MLLSRTPRANVVRAAGVFPSRRARGRSLRCALAALLTCIVSHAEPAPQADSAGARPDEPPPEEFDLLTFYRPNYFISGFDAKTPVKFQLSIKYAVWPTASEHALYFAYTQLSRWRLWDFADSSPFVENNYQPALFYEHTHPTQLGCGLLAEEVGVEHVSNGERTPRTGSYNLVFGRARGVCRGERGGLGLIGLTAWWPFGLEDNPDLPKYLGYGQLELGVGTPDGLPLGRFELAVTLRRGWTRELARGSVQADLSWHPRYGRAFTRSFRFLPFFYAQGFLGYAETLEQYDESTAVFRVGVGLKDRLSLLAEP